MLQFFAKMFKVCVLLTVLIVVIGSVQSDFQQSLISKIDEWDARYASYNVFGDWLKLIRTDVNSEKVEIDSSRGAAINAQSLQHHLYEDEGYLGRIDRFLRSHRLDIKFPAGEARSSKFKRFLIPFVVLMVLKKSIEVPIMLGVLSILAFKGLVAGLISLMLSSATALKSLLEHHSSSKVSYEVVPQVNHWSRAGMDYPNFEGNVGAMGAGGYQYHTLPHGAK